jgi:formate/nitrite transporter FocA (FNT family)
LPAPQPDEIYKRTRKEGRRRLSRPILELAATAVVGGFDVAFGVAALVLAESAFGESTGAGVARVAGAIAFGVGFVFVVVGRSELFTENFLVPITALERSRASWLKLGELWIVTLVLNIAAGALLAIVLTSDGVLRAGSAESATRVAEHLAGYGAWTGFLSAILAGALMTLMTWFVEGSADAVGVRIVMGWLVGSLIALGAFNHAIVSTIEMVFGMRYDAAVSYGDLFTNLGVAVAGNLVGGLALVTFVRSAQALAGGATAENS